MSAGRGLRIAADTGGTFTDLVIDTGSGTPTCFKVATTPDNPTDGVFAALREGSDELGISLEELLERTQVFIQGTTRAINAIVTGTTATTALLVTRGHPDILTYREGGRTQLFDYTRPAPVPYVPRSLTFEVPERIGAAGEIVEPLDEPGTRELLRGLSGLGLEAIAVCLLWAPVNPEHERRLGELIIEELPHVAVTLSHQLNPVLREYRRASSAAIDASLKPLMTAYFDDLQARLATHGFTGRLLVPVSTGGVMDALDVAAAPIYSIKSGPAMGTSAGRLHAHREGNADTAIVADAGGTTYDVSLVRRGRLPWTNETPIGSRSQGQITGFPSVDVRSIGAGGGSIAWIDSGGVLHVGPESAGAKPGPACYGRGGTRPTVTDASLILGFLDPDFFLGGAMSLEVDEARRALVTHVADPLGIDVTAAASAVVRLATEHMARGIEEITLYQGIDPSEAVLIAGGGAAGLNAVAVARRLGCPRVVLPATGPVMSAAGALEADLTADYATTLATSSGAFDPGVNAVLHQLRAECESFAAGPGAGAIRSRIELAVGARYPSQVWELDLPLRRDQIDGPEALAELVDDFHALHAETFSVADRGSPVDFVTWRARVSCELDLGGRTAPEPELADGREPARERVVHFESGSAVAAVRRLESLAVGAELAGPALVETSFTTVVLDPGAIASRRGTGALVIRP